MRLGIVLTIVTTKRAMAKRNHIECYGPRTVWRSDGNPVIMSQRPQQAFLITTDGTGMLPVVEHEGNLLCGPGSWQLALTSAATLLTSSILFRKCLSPCLASCTRLVSISHTVCQDLRLMCGIPVKKFLANMCGHPLSIGSMFFWIVCPPRSISLTYFCWIRCISHAALKVPYGFLCMPLRPYFFTMCGSIGIDSLAMFFFMARKIGRRFQTQFFTMLCAPSRSSFQVADMAKRVFAIFMHTRLAKLIKTFGNLADTTYALRGIQGLPPIQASVGVPGFR